LQVISEEIPPVSFAPNSGGSMRSLIITFCTFLSISVATLSNAQTFLSKPDSIPFTPAVNYGAGLGPASVFCADLDGDGDVDLAVANDSSSNVSILFNSGYGAFSTAVNYIVGYQPKSVFAADLDNDGNLDLATANSGSNNVSVLMNNGDGTFQQAVEYDLGESGNGPYSVFCVDLNGDDECDIVVACASSYNVLILYNNGDGTFELGPHYGVAASPISVFCSNLDGMWGMDAAVANSNYNYVTVLRNNGSGGFQSPAYYGTGMGPVSVFCADLDRDDDIDVVTANEVSDSVSVLMNYGNGTFQSKTDYAAGAGPFSVFCSDLNGDGYFDLAIANGNGNNVSILENSDATFPIAGRYGTGNAPVSVFCSDLDHDGDFDLAVANHRSNNVSVLRNLSNIPANQPPYPFSLFYPFGNDLYQDTTLQVVHFDWENAMDPDLGDQIHYNLFLSTQPDFSPQYTSVYPGLVVSHFTIVLPTGEYYWKVEAFDNWGASRWSNQACRFFNTNYLNDTLVCIAFSPVDFIINDPKGDSIGIGFSTIPGASYDTTRDYNHDGDNDDIATLPNRLVGDYTIRVFPEPPKKGTYSLGIRIDGGALNMLTTFLRCPEPTGVDTFNYHAPWYLTGDVNSDWNVDVGDVVYLINYLYRHGLDPVPTLQAGDVNCDSMVDVGDVVYLINYLFKSGPAPSC
jgi:hypothetical protein